MAETSDTASQQSVSRLELLTSALSYVSVAIAALYGIGFLVANAYHGSLWVVSPSLLQTRYATAGILWFLYTTASLVPCYYLLKAIRTPRSPHLAAGETETGIVDPWLRRIEKAPKSLQPILRVCALLVAIILLLPPVLMLALTPLVPGFLMVVLGGTLSDIWIPLFAFHAVLIGLGLFHHFIGLDSWETWAPASNPHRVVFALAAIAFHAILFGRSIYPAIPASAGGAKPLPARIILKEPSAIATLAQPGLTSSIIDNARVVSVSDNIVLALVPLAHSDSTRFLVVCPVAIPLTDISMIQVQPGKLEAFPPPPISGGPWHSRSLEVASCP